MDLVSMGIFTLQDAHFFLNMPSDLTLEFYQKSKLSYYQKLNEQNIAVAKMNTNLLLFFSSFGDKKDKTPDATNLFKQSLPFDPDVLQSKESDTIIEVSSETMDILRFYYKKKLIPEKVLQGINDDDQMKETLIRALGG